MRGVNFANENRRELREQIIADLGRIQERIELSAADCGLDCGWLFKVYQTVNSLILSGKGAREPLISEDADPSVYWLGGRGS